MKLTPLMIYQREFRRKAINGLDPEDVEGFLFQVAEGVEALVNENEELQRRLGRQLDASESPSTEPPDRAGVRSSRAVSARELEQARQEAKRVRENADQEARRVVAEARQQAEELLALAKRRAESRGHGSTLDPATVQELAREYQSLLVQHLSRITALLGDVERPRAVGELVEDQETDQHPTTRVGPMQ